ncbi:D-alanyl-D-alanine carboxypeptidase family protein [Streptomyces sp. NPDC059637]|uniref:D-alanyl-D-alanine carboxypeptidase family protein n=1 Tax=Streptomyces sp. NPDC059637 TaxID=3347752 RepID=UPI0036AB036A
MRTRPTGAIGRRRACALALAGAVLAVAVPASATPAQAATGPSGITAKGAFLLDNTANKTLWSKSADTKRQMASTTKVMTAAVVVSSGIDLDRLVTVKSTYRTYVAEKGASTADLKTGDKLTVRQLLYAMMLPSGCDAAYALADTVGTGSTIKARTASFIKKMNAKAAALGMTNTKYDSFDGISQTGYNYTTPRDAAKLTRYALKSTNIRTVVKSAKTVQKATNGRTYTWYNTNKLLGSYSGANGVKTGTGSVAGPCLIFSATRNGRTVVGVILNDANRYTSAARMLDYAYGTNTASTMQLRKLPAGAQRD